ncbi:TonB-dependent receptor [Neptuniibacter sp. CAU 1671]|uniref:TonB-dependent receptor n=1 Tax=Neptuniibacter sp. CAU 1671 TaxID=3032593 RepID=UPI0023DBC4ED|nr:TonB-dependent receptor [Neptuniibacter sp. CAU 1671]MDF2182419.1 TonB-dependent receptor [Neptuniibacter sp. CAU 1671]
MSTVDRAYLMTGLGYGILGLALGIHMAASKDHGQFVTHAHIMLAGFAVSFVYAVCHKLWLSAEPCRLGKLQFWLHQFGMAGIAVGLFLLYGQFLSPELLDPFLALSSIAFLLAMILMKVMIIRARKQSV